MRNPSAREHIRQLRWRRSREAASRCGFDRIDWPAVLSSPEPYLVKHSFHRELLYLPATGEHRGMFVKRFYPTRWWPALQQRCTGSRAAREFHVARFLRRRGIPTAEPLAYCRLPGGLLGGGSVYAAEELPSRQTLADFLSSEARRAVRLAALRLYGGVLGQLNRCLLYPDDFHLDNVIIAQGGDGLIRHWVIDHEASRPLVGLFRIYRLKSLAAALYSKPEQTFSQEETEAVLSAYLQELHRREPSAAEIGALLNKVKEHHRRAENRRERRRRSKPFRGPERRGALSIFHRRDVNGAELAAAFESLCSGGALELIAVGGNREPAEGMLLSADTLPARVLFLCGPALGAGRRRLRRAAAQGNDVLGYVERRPFGPAALFWRCSRPGTE